MWPADYWFGFERCGDMWPEGRPRGTLSLGIPEATLPNNAIPRTFFVLDHQPHLFMARVKGVTLHSRWSSMSVSQKESVCSKLDAMLSDLHGIPWTPGVPLGSLIPLHLQRYSPSRPHRWSDL